MSDDARHISAKLPAPWAIASLGDVAHIEMGQSPPSEFYNEAGDGLPFFQGKAEFGEMHPTVKKWCSRPGKVAPAGSILMSVRAPVGPTNLAIERCAIGRGLAAITPRPGIETRYVLYAIRCFVDALAKQGTGTTFGAVNGRQVSTFTVPIAPSHEQTRIADRIDELFTDLSAGVAALERVKRNLSRYRAAVLHAAVTGRLTEAWRKEHSPADEPGPKLLERILAERRRQWEQRTLAKYEKDGKQPPKNWKSRYPEPAELKPLVDGAELPPLPKSWCWASTDQLGWVQLGRQRSPKNRSDKFPTKYIRAANITENGLDLSDVLDMEFQPHELEVYRLIAGDIVLSEASGSATQVGKPAVWRNELPDCAFQNTVIRLRPAIVGSEYLYTFFLYCYRCRVFATVAGGVGINHLSADKFSRIPVALPPMAEQAAIVEAVHEKLSQIDALEGEVERGLRRAGRLRQAILKAAFEGKLVPQDPNDEPASVLLERIRREAASAELKRARKPRRRKKSSGKVTAS